VSRDLSEVPVRRVALVGCGLAFLLVGIAAVVFLGKAGDLLARALAAHQPRIEARLPADLPQAERTRLAWAFEGAEAALRDGDADADALDRVQRRLAAIEDRGSGHLTRDEVADLTADLEAIAGKQPAAVRPP